MHKRVSVHFAPSTLPAMPTVKELGFGNIAARSSASVIRQCVYYVSHGHPLNFVLYTRPARVWTEE